MDSICDKICVGDGTFFYFSDDGKLDLCYILKRRYPVITKNSSVFFLECTKMNLKTSYSNGVFILILLNGMGW